MPRMPRLTGNEAMVMTGGGTFIATMLTTGTGGPGGGPGGGRPVWGWATTVVTGPTMAGWPACTTVVAAWPS